VAPPATIPPFRFRKAARIAARRPLPAGGGRLAVNDGVDDLSRRHWCSRITSTALFAEVPRLNQASPVLRCFRLIPLIRRPLHQNRSHIAAPGSNHSSWPGSSTEAADPFGRESKNFHLTQRPVTSSSSRAVLGDSELLVIRSFVLVLTVSPPLWETSRHQGRNRRRSVGPFMRRIDRARPNEKAALHPG
jgi:hypothetical protein